MMDFIEEYGTGLFIFTVVPLALIGIVYWLSSSQCSTYAELTGYPKNFSVAGGCLLKQDGRWVKADIVFGHKEEITLRQKEQK